MLTEHRASRPLIAETPERPVRTIITEQERSAFLIKADLGNHGFWWFFPNKKSVDAVASRVAQARFEDHVHRSRPDVLKSCFGGALPRRNLVGVFPQ